jgi:hypothetical protein
MAKAPTPNLLPTVTKRDGKTHHFFATSLGEWRVGTDVGALIDYFKRQKYNFAVYLVPGTVDSAYKIDCFAPQVEGTVWLATYEA